MLYHLGTSERLFFALARFGATQAGLKGRWPPYDLYIYIYIYIASDRCEIRHITVGLAGARPNELVLEEFHNHTQSPNEIEQIILYLYQPGASWPVLLQDWVWETTYRQSCRVDLLRLYWCQRRERERERERGGGGWEREAEAKMSRVTYCNFTNVRCVKLSVASDHEAFSFV